MLPYFELKTITLGPVTIQVWGLMVALGFVLGALTVGWIQRRHQDSSFDIWRLLPWVMFWGIIGGRLGHVLFYEPAYFLMHPLEIFALWQGGLSMFGGLIAASIYLIIKLKYHSTWSDLIQKLGTLAFGLPIGAACGRIGCFLIHDHPGTLSSSFLAIQSSDGVGRHDLGLYEAIFFAILAVDFFLIERLIKPDRRYYLAIFLVSYGLFRLIADHWRVIDTRFWGITPGQYLGGVILLLGLFNLIRRKSQSSQISSPIPRVVDKGGDAKSIQR